MLFNSLGRELLPRLVAAFHAAGELDLVAGNFPFIVELSLVPTGIECHGERDLVPADLPVGDRIVPLPSRNGPGQLVALGLEVEGGLAGLAVLAGDLGNPLAIDIGGPSHRQGSKHQAGSKKYSFI